MRVEVESETAVKAMIAEEASLKEIGLSRSRYSIYLEMIWSTRIASGSKRLDHLGMLFSVGQGCWG